MLQQYEIYEPQQPYIPMVEPLQQEPMYFRIGTDRRNDELYQKWKDQAEGKRPKDKPRPKERQSDQSTLAETVFNLLKKTVEHLDH